MYWSNGTGSGSVLKSDSARFRVCNDRSDDHNAAVVGGERYDVIPRMMFSDPLISLLLAKILLAIRVR